VEHLRRELAQGSMRHRSEVFARVQAALGRLREVTTIDVMLRQIAEELVYGIGFSRVILSRVRDSLWVPEICIVEGDPEWGDDIVRAGQQQEQLLDHMILETEMVRRRAPMLVLDVQNDPRTHQPIAAASFSRTYVAAPIMPDGRVIGFLHVDGYMHRRHMDDFDRDVLWMFAEGAGYALERTVLLERQQNLREHIHRLTGSIREALDDVVDADVELERMEREATGGGRTATHANALADPRSVLTRREHDVARLMATGMTNAEMARRLIISEGTAKTHVSSILRKLGAANRAQAVSRYLELARDTGPGFE
jgi:DNA-binding CsgD family transcriptional regulator